MVSSPMGMWTDLAWLNGSLFCTFMSGFLNMNEYLCNDERIIKQFQVCVFVVITGVTTMFIFSTLLWTDYKHSRFVKYGSVFSVHPIH